MVSLSQALEAKGLTYDSGGSLRDCVQDSADFRRIRDMPRRRWEGSPTLQQLIDDLTTWFSLPGNPDKLRPVQAAGLAELHDKRGAFLTARVGAGKTLLAGLAPVALGAKRAMYLTRGGALSETKLELMRYAGYWKIAPFALDSYDRLSRDYDGEILGKLQPDLIMCDESDAMASPGSGRFKTLVKYARAKRKEEHDRGLPHGTLLVVLMMCGTATDTAIHQYWHLMRLALGEAAPLPKDWNEMRQWGWAIDEGVRPENRWHPGALLRLTLDAPGATELERARNGFGERLRLTPGVVTTGDQRPPNELHIRAIDLQAPKDLAESIQRMRRVKETPDGHPFEMPLEAWRHAREMQCGFYNVWDPRPPVEWLAVRKTWTEARNEALANHAFSTPGHLVKSIEKGALWKNPDLVKAWNAWKEAKATYTYKLVPMWVDDTCANACAEWLERNKGLLWVEFPALGERLEKLTGTPFYHQKALHAKSGARLAAHKPGRPAIASVKSCGVGLNLQRIFSKNCYASPMSTNKDWEQSLGRTHRDGNPEKIVTADVMMMVVEAYSSMVHAIRKAEMVQQTLRQAQKLVYAEVRDFAKIEALIARRYDDMWKQEIDGV